MTKVAKIFNTGGSQAVRLPAEFRFDASEVYIRRDPATGDVILSRKPADWRGFLDAVRELPADESLLDESDQVDVGPSRAPFEDWSE